MSGSARFFARVAVLGGVSFLGYSYWKRHHNISSAKDRLFCPPEEAKHALEWRPPTRPELLENLRKNHFDLIIVGGGATGTGCAVDGASRGLKIALLERDDFSSGTSSKSTKLVHGGVRYLEKAFLQFDWEQFQMVREALQERTAFLRIAPHLTSSLPIMLPIYQWYRIPYYWLGSKVYDILAGQKCLEESYFLSKSKALEAFPMLKKDQLVGAMVYYDGEQNDARTNISLALTAIQQGAIATNYTEVIGLLKDDVSGRIVGVKARDRINGEVFEVRAKGVISATGPFCDSIRTMDDANCKNIVQPSTGTHIVFPSYYSPRNMGLIDPSSSDGRVIFFLPWEGNTIAGTTDAPAKVTYEPKASKKEVDFIVNEVRRYLNPEIQVRSSDVLASWSGLRPLVRDPTKTLTQELVRNHIVIISDSGLMTIAGGKWTTYRKMAEETINAAIKHFDLSPISKDCKTTQLRLIGAHGFDENLYIKLIQQFGLETEVATHLAHNYGDRAFIVAAMAEESGQRWPLYGQRLCSHYPYLESEVRYAVRFEYALTAVDVLARRTRLAHLSCRAANDALPRVIKLMAQELGWSAREQEEQFKIAQEYLKTCGIDEIHHARSEFAREQLQEYKSVFQQFVPHQERDRWPRLPYDKAIVAWSTILGSNIGIHWLQLAQLVDKQRTGSIGLQEFLEGISLVNSIQQKDYHAESSLLNQCPIQKPNTDRNNWSA